MFGDLMICEGRGDVVTPTVLLEGGVNALASTGNGLRPCLRKSNMY